MLKSECAVYIDKNASRLVYVGREADEEYWDGHWLNSLTADDIRQPDRFVVSVTKRYLPEGAKVVDAGCGVARTVFGLQQAGFDAYGIDFAPDTVATINRLAPELKVSVADVRDMSDFTDGFFDGIWSLGVVEHFYDGYDAILEETYRLLRPGGIAFVTVPSMSPLRKLKASIGGYPSWSDSNRDGFYQFILDPKSVVANFESVGFKLVETKSRGGFKGLKDEIGPLRKPLQSMYDSKITALRATRAVLDRVLGPLTYHTRLYVFQKTARTLPTQSF